MPAYCSRLTRSAPCAILNPDPMMTEKLTMWQSYEMPTSVEEALDTLARFDGRAQIIAGGTDLIIELQEGKHTVECLVDITRIPGLDRIEQLGEWIVIGANVTLRQIKDSSLLQEQARVLAEAAATVGALQIQTVATPVSYTHLTLPTTIKPCSSRWSPCH